MIRGILCHHREDAVHVLSIPSLQFFDDNAQVLSFSRSKIGERLGIAVQQIPFCHVFATRGSVLKRLFQSRVICPMGQV